MNSTFVQIKALILAVCIFALVGCDDDNDGPQKPFDQFSFSVLTSESGVGVDLLAELNNSVLPRLENSGARVFAIWSRASNPNNPLPEIAEDKLVVMLRWKEVKATRLSDELGAMNGVTHVATSMWELSLRGGDGAIETGTGFYIHRFNRYLSENVDEVLDLSEQAWVTSEPYWENKVVGVWRNLDEVEASNGITQLMRIAWYRDWNHWQVTRDIFQEPESAELFIQRFTLQLDDEGWSANLQPR